MGVSSDNSGLDLNAIVSGGEDFIKRLAEFQTAAAAYKTQLDDLALGKAAKDAFNEAGRVLQEAKNKRDADMATLANDVTTARAALSSWSDQIKQQANAMLEAAQTKMSEAESKLSAANAAQETANGIVGAAQAQADKITASAKTAASKALSDASDAAAQLKADAASVKAAADAAMSEALAVKARYADALAKIQSAIVPAE